MQKSISQYHVKFGWLQWETWHSYYFYFSTLLWFLFEFIDLVLKSMIKFHYSLKHIIVEAISGILAKIQR